METLDNVNWLEEVRARQDELLEDLFRILKIESVRDDAAATVDAPVGPGPKAAMEEFLKMADEDGFVTQQFGPWVGRIDIGEGDETFGILGHVDVVPPGNGWDSDPFEPRLEEGRVIARGALDDKGPMVAAYMALKILRDKGVTFNKRIQLLIGTDEESGWSCMKNYLLNEPAPDFGFSPDSRFPIVNGEKGNVSVRIKNKSGASKKGQAHLVKFKAGLRKNMVPEVAEATIQSPEAVELVATIEQSLGEQSAIPSYEVTVEGDVIDVRVEGEGAHGSTPEKGLNAGTHLAYALRDISMDDEAAQDFIKILANELHLNHDGAKLEVDMHHEVMGHLSMNVGIIHFKEADGGEIDCNFRYPTGSSGQEIANQMKVFLKKAGYNLFVEMQPDRAPHFVPSDDPIVTTLLDVYERQTGQKGYEKTIGGGTYAQLMPRGVAYGVLFPDSVDMMHKANEYIELDDLLLATSIFTEAIYRLSR